MPTAALIRRWGAVFLATALLVGACDSAPPPVPTPVPSSSSIPTTPSPVAPSRSPVGSPGNSAGTPGSSAGPGVPAIAWSDCGNGFECGSVLVPLDYKDPSGASMLISVIRLRASDPSKRIGSLVLDPGGPGGSGVDFVRSSATAIFSPEVLSRFDIVGFDPRGVNGSSGIRCVDNLDHFLSVDDTPDTPAELAALLAGEKQFAAACQRRNAAVLPFLGTANVVRDLDRLRAALGEPKLTYFGFSYGTLIGTLYAQAYPERSRALVLDGALDPRLDLAGMSKGQAVAFEGAYKRFLSWCATDTTCEFHHGGKPGPAVDTLMRRIEKAPLPATLIGDPRVVGPSLALSAIVGAMYDRAAWPVLARGLALAEAGDGSILLLLSDPHNGRDQDGGYSNLIDANSAISCLDYPSPRDPAPFEADARAWAVIAPHFGAFAAYSSLVCAFWAVPPVRVAGPVSAPDAPPIVIVGSTGDPATPYPWAVALSHQLTTSVLVTRTGEGHTGYAYSTCVQTAVDAYLIDLTVPKKGLVCSSD